MTTKRTTLAELNWHTFSNTDPQTEEYVSLYKGIAVILESEETLKPFLSEYIKRLNRIEYIEAADTYVELYLDENAFFDDFLDLPIHFDRDIPCEDDVIFNKVCIPDLPGEQRPRLETLDIRRTRVCELMGPPVSIIYLLLQAEIEKYKRNKNKASIRRIITKTINGYDNFYFKREHILKWKALSAVEELGLLDANLKPKRKTAGIKEENIQKVIGMLMYLLKNQPLTDKYGDIEFEDNSGKIIISKFYKVFEERYLAKDMSIFPVERKVFDILNDAYYEAFLEDVRFKETN